MKITSMQTILLIVTSLALTACGKVATNSVSTTTTAGGLLGNPAQQVATTDSNLVPSGNWSASQAELSVTDSGASLKLTCAAGTLNSALVLDANNSFAVQGTYSPLIASSVVSLNGGSVKSNQNQPVIYAGAYNADQKTLTILISNANTGITISNLVLTFGNPASPIINCE
jgi:hypothetical protein